MKKLKYDVIGYWSEVKLDIIREYATAYSKIVSAQPSIKKHLYIDAFAGAGHHISKTTGDFVKGSPLNALLVQPPFSEFHLIDVDGDKTNELRRVVGPRTDVKIYGEDANTVLLKKVFPSCRYEDYCRGLCLLDPYALTVDWRVIAAAGKMKSIEIFFNFMIMDANMNVLLRNPDHVSEEQAARLEKTWGDRSWRSVAYQRDQGLFEDMEKKTDNKTVAEAFRKRLKDVAGFNYVPEPMPMRNDQGATVYYLYFASPNKTGARIVSDIFKKYREKGVR
ncbi:MAG TPA: three-Cys-motif partner protein TcmP [Pyrinomonadaceae bacterium]|nr:three-Cys-motif partner protein TcmP [Pyrinomonadaceae bacterium]